MTEYGNLLTSSFLPSSLPRLRGAEVGGGEVLEVSGDRVALGVKGLDGLPLRVHKPRLLVKERGTWMNLRRRYPYTKGVSPTGLFRGREGKG